MENLEIRIKNIEDRNRKVELDKKWETSPLRIFVVGTITYIFAVLTLYIIGTLQPFLSGFIPVVGFILSTQSISIIKKIWMKGK